MNRIVLAACVGGALLLSACASISSVPAGPVALGDGQSVTLSREWSDISALLPQRQKSVRVLTIDGPMLNRLYLGQLERGQGLIRAAAKEKPVPTYRADMSPTELVEFMTDSVAALGYQRVETSKLRPAKLAGGDGVRFDLHALTESGLEIAGTAELAESKGKLYLVVYVAPAEHYFQAALPDVESILRTGG